MSRHGIFTTESATAYTVPKTANTAILAIGCAPVYMLDDPQAAVNTPILATKATEAMSKLGYSLDFDRYGLCEVMYSTTNVCVVGPVVYINVLDPVKHRKPMAEQAVDVVLRQARVAVTGVLKDGLVVKSGDAELQLGLDYMLNYDTQTGDLLIELAAAGAGAMATSLMVSGDVLDPDAVTAADVVGAIDMATGKRTGLEVLREVYPKLDILCNLLVAPGFSHIPEVAIAMAAKADAVNGRYKAMALVDLDTEKCRSVEDCKKVKEDTGVTTSRAIPMWPCVNVGSLTLNASSVMGPFIAELDYDNGGVPYMSPSNRTVGITGTCLRDGTEIVLDPDLAAVADDNGIMTFFNDNGWRMWGDYTGAAPGEGDPKDLWICCRRMFDYCENNFMLTFAYKVDWPMSVALIENIINSENEILNGLVKAGKMAFGEATYIADLNPKTNIIAGILTIKIRISPWTPARDIEGDFEFDVDQLANALYAAA